LVPCEKISGSRLIFPPPFSRGRPTPRVFTQSLVFNLPKRLQTVSAFCAVSDKEVRAIGRRLVDFRRNDEPKLPGRFESFTEYNLVVSLVMV
jgi:hypothetical protein